MTHNVIKKSVLRTVRLDDDVWAAIKGMDCSLNLYLRGALLAEDVGEVVVYGRDEIPPRANYREDVEKPKDVGERMQGFDPRSVPGVALGVSAGSFPCRCVHSGCKGSKFQGTTRFQNLCPACLELGHQGEPRNCEICFEDTGPA